MLRADLLRTTTFRLSLWHAGLFAASALIVFAFIYVTTIGALDREIGTTITEEIQSLRDVYAELGPKGLEDTIEERSAPGRGAGAIYLLTDSTFHPLAGNISIWPAKLSPEEQWVYFDIAVPRAGSSETHEVRARTFHVEPGLFLLVGRDIHNRTDVRRRLLAAFGWGFAVTLALGMAAGVISSRSMLRRVETIAAAGRRIMQGQFAERIPTRGTDDELDHLAQNLNQMLDEIERLMVGMQTVSESIAHDLRSPLTHLKGRIELALKGPSDSKTFREALEQTVAEADRILAMFNALIGAARAEAGIGRREFERLDLAEVVRDVVELYEPLADEKEQALDFQVLGAAPCVGHRQLLSQAVLNLLDNAVKYTPEGGRIAVRVGSTGAAPFVTIEDTGPGIPEDQRENALKRFVRIAPSPERPGSGLGLALVSAVAKLHRATLVLHDNAPGLRVELTLPAPPGAQRAEARRLAP